MAKQRNQMRASIAALERWSRVENPTAETQPARAGLEASFVSKADVTGTLSVADPEAFAKNLARVRRLHYRKLAYQRWHGKGAQDA